MLVEKDKATMRKREKVAYSSSWAMVGAASTLNSPGPISGSVLESWPAPIYVLYHLFLLYLDLLGIYFALDSAILYVKYIIYFPLIDNRAVVAEWLRRLS